MTEFSYSPGKDCYNFLDSTFDYWDDDLLPTPYEVLQLLRSHTNENLTQVVEILGISAIEKQIQAKNILWIFLHESGNSVLIQKYKL